MPVLAFSHLLIRCIDLLLVLHFLVLVWT